MRRSNERDEYLTRVEEFVCQRRLSPLFLSPKEWTVAQGWKEDEIPLVVVFQGIEKATRSLPSDGGEFSKRRLTLSYCNRSVRAAFKRYVKAKSLFPDELGEAEPAGHRAAAVDSDTLYILNRLDSLAQQAKALLDDERFEKGREQVAALVDALEVLSAGTKRSRRGQWLQRLQTELVKLDAQLIALATLTTPRERLNGIREQVERQLAELKSLDDEALRGRLVDGAVREELGLFTIGLFDL